MPPPVDVPITSLLSLQRRPLNVASSVSVTRPLSVEERSEPTMSGRAQHLLPDEISEGEKLGQGRWM
jgi:hypothetical protein